MRPIDARNQEIIINTITDVICKSINLLNFYVMCITYAFKCLVLFSSWFTKSYFISVYNPDKITKNCNLTKDART